METFYPPVLAVLVPHRDCLPALDANRRDLFAGGIDGAFSFPAASPLALLKRPLDSAELKNAAAALRKLMGGRRIAAAGQAEYFFKACGVNSSEMFRFFGTLLELPVNSNESLRKIFPADAVLQFWEKPVLAPAILAPGDTLPPLKNGNNMDKGFLLPRAAALANLIMKPVSGFQENYSFSWELGPLFWLPGKGP